ncbi:hypothetical protein PRZ48_008540 [Zasmidium cellare]|uniref:Uncharacterized protein n=1 Tax=Zasmidium cellare TaxID=395010 RepID=A0ABR0EGG4_ZASCE|nr:hypothetical protein PRZ48_008540 [Zasmidium cellare]
MDDEKEVVVAPTPPTQKSMPEEKIPCIMDDEKEVVVDTRQQTIPEEKIVLEAGDEVSQRPVLKSLSVFRTTDDSRELLDPDTGTTVYNVGLEIKKHFLRPDEHFVTVRPGTSSPPARAKVNAKSGDIHLSTGDNEPSQKLEKADCSTSRHDDLSPSGRPTPPSQANPQRSTSSSKYLYTPKR